MGSGGESRAPASGGNFPATLMILLKPSISREMKSLFQTHFLQLNIFIYIYIYRYMCSYMCVYMYVCGICAFM